MGSAKLTPPLLFSLPLELREQVYKEVFASPNQGSALLQTCREIRAEAHKFLFLRPASFSSQESFFRRLDQAPKHLLRHVTDISLIITDIKFTSILDGHLSRDQSASPLQLRSSGLYDRELERLALSLRQLPNIKTVTIRAFRSLSDHLYQEFLTKVLRMLSSVYPTLADLRLEGDMHRQSLAYLTTLKHLSSFSFDGFSASTSMETARILASLEDLNSLSLVSQQGTNTPTSPRLANFTSKPQSFNGDVVRTINQLASFSVAEHKSTPAPALFFTAEVLASLHKHKKLNNLSISLSQIPDNETLEALQFFLEKSTISWLELDWPELQCEVLEQLSLVSAHLQSLWVRAKGGPDAASILGSALRARQEGRMQELRKVVLIRSAVDETDKLKVDEAKADLQALGVQVAWCTEECSA